MAIKSLMAFFEASRECFNKQRVKERGRKERQLSNANACKESRECMYCMYVSCKYV
jgi:hypothetical protein